MDKSAFALKGFYGQVRLALKGFYGQVRLRPEGLRRTKKNSGTCGTGVEEKPISQFGFNQ